MSQDVSPPAEYTLSPFDYRFFSSMLALMRLYDLVDADRDLVRDEIEFQLARWVDVVGSDLATLDDQQAIEEKLCEVLEID